MRWHDAQLDAMRELGDPFADDVVRDVFVHHDVDEMRAILRSLIDHDDPRAADLPDGLSAYLEATAVLPAWADVDRIARGQRVFSRWGVAISVALFCASLPSAYACKKGVQVLGQTARLETDTRRRIMETGQFLIDVLGPRGLEPGGKGILAIQRVRLMHAAVRHLILVHQARAAAAAADGLALRGPTPWNSEWGRPINQEDLAGTLLSFSYTVVEPLPRMGIVLPEADREDYLYVWRVIGHMLGLRDDMIPHTTAESTQLVTLIRTRQYGRSDDGVLMTKALVDLLVEMSPSHGFGRWARGETRHAVTDLIGMLIGSDAAALLDLDASGRRYGFLRWLLVLIRRTTHDVENDRVLRDVATHLGWYVLNGLYDAERQGEHRTSFELPDELADGWGLDSAPTRGGGRPT